MIDRILNNLPTGYTRDSVAGAFLSSFTKEQSLLFSQGMITTDKTLEVVLSALWDEYFKDQKALDVVAVDVVTDTIEIHDFSTLGSYDPQEFGFVMIDNDDDRSGVILPNTEGITDAKHALWAMKEKYALHGKVEVIAFRTYRNILAK